MWLRKSGSKASRAEVTFGSAVALLTPLTSFLYAGELLIDGALGVVELFLRAVLTAEERRELVRADPPSGQSASARTARRHRVPNLVCQASGDHLNAYDETFADDPAPGSPVVGEACRAQIGPRGAPCATRAKGTNRQREEARTCGAQEILRVCISTSPRLP